MAQDRKSFMFFLRYSVEEQQRAIREQQVKIQKDKSLQELQTRLQLKKEERLRRAEEMAVKPNAKSAARTRSLIRCVGV